MTTILQGFTFKAIHSSTVGIYLDSPARVLYPSMRQNIYVIPGRDGTLDYGEETYEPISLALPISYIADESISLRQRQRSLAQFFRGSGDLVFDDEPDKAYTAKAPSAPDIEEIIGVGKTEITFECQPFAQNVAERQSIALAADLPHEMVLESAGTIRCPCIIRIINRGDVPITNMQITRVAEQ